MMAWIAKGFHARWWLLGTSGNLSAVVERERLRLAMSSSGVDKGELTPDQVLSIDENAPIIIGPFGVIGENVEQRPRVIGVSAGARF